MSSWFSALERYADLPQYEVNRAWGAAWSGRGVGWVMQAENTAPFGQIIQPNIRVQIHGGQEYDMRELASAFEDYVTGPYDMSMIIRSIKGQSEQYSQRRVQLKLGDTYFSIQTRLTDILIRRYEVGELGQLSFIGHTVIGLVS